MKILIFILAFLATAPAMADSYIKSPGTEKYILEDTADRLSRDFPAANTTFVLNKKDNTSTKLSQILGNKGFAISFDNNQIRSPKNQSSIELDDSIKQGLINNGYLFPDNPANPNPNETKQLRIVLDAVDKDLFRVIYTIDNLQFSRAYIKSSAQDDIKPAGSWSIKRN